MASLFTIKGPNPGRRYPLDERGSTIGRQPDANVYLESLAVSRLHARLEANEQEWFIEDLGSSNGTFVNGHRIGGRVPISDRDTVVVGPYELALHIDSPLAIEAQVIRSRVDAGSGNHTLFANNAGHKLQLLLHITRDIGGTLDIDVLLNTLLDHLLRLFTQADRGMVLLCEGEQMILRAQKSRMQKEREDYPYSRTIVRKALEEGIGILSEDVRGDRNLVMSATLVSLNLRSFLCVPLLGWDDCRLGVLQLDCLRPNQAFRHEDLELLTTICLQASTALQSATYHSQRLREERLRQEILMARDIQQQFLPADFDLVGKEAEFFAKCLPAREVSGDLYDLFRLPDGRIAFYIGDVSGKGMPAALFMIAVRTLARHLAPAALGANDFIQRLNTALANENPTHLFVTLLFGIYDRKGHSVLLASGGHPQPLLRRAEGTVEEVAMRPGLLLGSSPIIPKLPDVRVELKPGETLIFYTDGYLEETAADGKTEFGVERLREAIGGARTKVPLDVCQNETSALIRRWAGREEQMDDQTMLLLRRKG
jgi:serine phosphatase RsbU (regulator of sigma subunit)